MNDGVGRAADRQQNAQRVLDGLLIDNLVGRQLRADQLHRGSAGCLGRAQPVGMHGRNCRRSRQNHAKRFSDAGHGRSGAHDGAGAGGRRETPFDFRNFIVVDLSGAVLRPEAAAVGAGAQPLAAMAAGHHRAGDQHDCRLCRGHRAHELGRHRLVATAHQHDRIHGLRAHHLLGVHRHQVTEFQAGRIEEDLAERDRWKLDRQRAGRQHAALHRLQQVREVPMAIVEA